jgi:hypothetical protein
MDRRLSGKDRERVWCAPRYFRKELTVFPVFLTISLVLVAGSSMYMSVFGLMGVFVNHAKVILCTGLGMEIGKILVVSHLYRSWETLRWPSRIFYSSVVFVLVVLTSIEVVGFLSQSQEYATHDLRIAETNLAALRSEASVIKEELSVIDSTLAGLPNSHVTRRIEERNKLGYREKQERLLEITRQEGNIQTRIITERQNAGPIFAAARIMGIRDTDAVAMLVLLLVLVLEPLSIGLTVATTAAWAGQKSTPRKTPEPVFSLDKEFIELTEKHSLTVGQIVRITGRKKPKTCEEWLNGKAPVPPKALRAVKAWANRQTKGSIAEENTKRREGKKRLLSDISAQQE